MTRPQWSVPNSHRVCSCCVLRQAMKTRRVQMELVQSEKKKKERERKHHEGQRVLCMLGIVATRMCMAGRQ